MSNFSANIQAILDTTKIPSQIKNIEQKYKIKFSTEKFDTSGIVREMKSVGEIAGKSFSSAISSSLNNIHLKNGGIGNIKNMLQGAGFDSKSIARATQDLDRLILSINKISTKQSNNGNIRMTINGVDEIGRAVQIVREFDSVTGKVANTSKSFTQSFNTGTASAKQFSQSLKQVTTAISSGSIEASLARVNRQYQTLSSTIKNIGTGESGTELHTKLQQIETDLLQLNQLQQTLSSKDVGSEKLVATYKEFGEVLARVKNGLTTITASAKQFASAMEVATLQNKMENWLNNNTRVTEEYRTQVQNYINTLKHLSTQGNVSTADLNKIADGFKKVDMAAESAGLKGKSFGSSISGAFKSITRYVGASTLIYSAFNAIKSGAQDVIALDTALVDLQKTTNATSNQLKEFYFSANDTAKQLDVTTKEVIQAAADWSRLGYSIKDAQTMAEVSSIFASISPEMDIETATDGLVSAMKAFDIEAEDALDGIASKINAIGNTQAVSNNDIVDFLTRSSSAMKEANNTLEETIALGTAATEITRDAASVGNALKTVSMRIRGYDEETSEYVGGIEELSGAIADLTKTASKPGGISLFTDVSKTEFKSTTELLRDISEIYDELTDKQQADLLEKLAGQRQGQIIAAILNNFDAVDKSLDTMADSAGGAMKEMEIIEESLEFKLNALKETAVGVFQNLFQTDEMGTVIDILTDILEIFDFLTEKLGLFGTIIAGIGITAFIKNFD